MSIASIFSSAEKFLVSVLSGATKLQEIFSKLSTPTATAAATVFYDAVKALEAAEAAAAAAGTGNIPSAVTMSETTFALVKQVVADAKAGEATVVADFKALGINF